MKRRSLVVAFVAVMSLAAVTPPRAETPAPDGWTLQGVVLYGRHSLRSPTKPVLCLDADDTACMNNVGQRPWPDFGVVAGNLLPQAYPRVRALGAYFRSHYAEQGLVPAAGCPATRQAATLYSDDERTTMTAGAFADGFAAGCAAPIHADAATYSGGAACAIDREAEAAAALAFVGGSWRNRAEGDLARPLAVMNEVLGPFAPGGCARSGLEPGCSIATADPAKAIAMASTPAEQILFEYAAGYPDAEVGWGRLAGAAGLPLGAAVSEVNAIHALSLAATNMPPAIGARPGSKSLSLVLHALERFATKPEAEPAPVVAFFSHDTLILHLAGMLGLDWTLESYNPHQIPPGGVIAFELWKTPAGDLRVRSVYRAQTIEQLREARPLGADDPPTTSVMAIKGCAMADGACPWSEFAAIAEAAIDPACTGE